MTENNKRIVHIFGHDQYGRFQTETVEVPSDGRSVTSKLSYAYLGLFLPEDFIVPIGGLFNDRK